jgi:3',5'-cyclic AMP phosphodiesterase CpdA
MSTEHARRRQTARHVIAHFSDTHFVSPADPLLYGVADSRAHLADLLAGLEASGIGPDALLFTGDLADVGDAVAYRSLRDIVEPAAQRMGARVIWAMGNHDDRATLRRELTLEVPSDAPLDYTLMLDGLRVVVLDSTVPGHHHGEVTPAQRAWLADQLAVPAPEGTLLVMHHPPVPCLQDLAVEVELRDQASLAPVLRGTDVRAVLAGHLHYSTSATFAGIPVSVASATCYTQDLRTPDGGTRGRDGAQAFNLVHVYDETVMHTVVPIGEHVTVGRSTVELDPASVVAAGTVSSASSAATVPAQRGLVHAR